MGKSGIIQQLTKRLIEHALAGELSHHLNQEASANSETEPIESKGRNSRNEHIRLADQRSNRCGQ